MKDNNSTDYPGAKWWKFDFHAHTPASMDVEKDIKSEFWLQKFMEKEIDCVAITDHNSGGWIDKLKKTLEKLEKDKPDWYRPLHLFPGVEISAHGGVHILAIFAPEKTEKDIYSLVDAVDYNGTKGHSNGETKESAIKVVDKIAERGGIPILAHVAGNKGVFNSLKGAALNNVLNNSNIVAMELRDEDVNKLPDNISKKFRWTKVVGSDTHNFEDSNFGRFTWIKMDTPTLEGLRLALIDGKASVNRDIHAKPNQHSEFILEELKIERAKHIGEPDPITCEFSPFLNTIIGGRGSGKSTLLEFMRLILRRDKDKDIPKNIREDRYFQSGDNGLLTDDSKLSLVYRKNKIRYRLSWSENGDVHPLEVEKDNGVWIKETGDIATLFPVSIYSQKHIFELSNNPQALLDIIDKDERVDYERLEGERMELSNEYRNISLRIHQLKNKVSQEKKLVGELNDITRQIEQIEKSGHKSILQKYRHRKQQLNTIEDMEVEWKKIADLLADTEDAIEPANFNKEYFNNNQDILLALEKNNEKWIKIRGKLTSITKEAREVIESWIQEKNAAEWKKFIDNDMSEYKKLKTQLEQQGIDPDKYPLLLQKQATIKNELSQIKTHYSEIKSLENTRTEKLIAITENRKLLNKNRRVFLSKVLDGKKIGMEIKPFAEKRSGVEESIRQILLCEGRFDKDIESLMDIYEQDGYQRMKDEVMAIYRERRPRDMRFLEHLKNLHQEQRDEFHIWLPKDHLVVILTDRNQVIEQGSPGQKCASLLAFILAYGKSPLLLDQPEDDLDNELIYNLIVKQIRATKSNRQIIVVTHNANIVVNGDAEMVIPLKVKGRQTQIQSGSNGSIQSKVVREEICTILEGGRDAFEQRHRRIHLED